MIKIVKKIVLTTGILTAMFNSSFAQKKEALIEVATFGNNQPIGVSVAPLSNRLLYLSLTKNHFYMD
jgi:hypothetical protein